MYYSYCPEDGIKFHDTEEEAFSRAEDAKECIEFHAADSDWDWHDRADEVSWGKVIGKAFFTDRELTAEEKSENPDLDFHRTYTLESLSASQQPQGEGEEG